MAKLPPLARTVAVGTVYYRAGDTPPLHHARKITNPRNWEGGKTPDFDAEPDPAEPETGTSGDADDTERTGLDGLREDQGGAQTGGEGAGTGNEGDTGHGDGGPDAPATGDGDGGPEAPATGDTTAPTRTAARKAAPVKVATSAK